MGNYSFKIIDLPDPVNGVIEGHNFTQSAPHTAIYSGYTGLTFRNCNLLNCDVPVDSIAEQCQRSQVSFCSHLHPDWVSYGYIPACAIDCTHRTVVDVITVDGVVVDTNYTYEDKGV